MFYKLKNDNYRNKNCVQNISFFSVIYFKCMYSIIIVFGIYTCTYFFWLEESEWDILSKNHSDWKCMVAAGI